MGRPVGVKETAPRNTAARKQAELMALEGISPLQVLLEAMRESVDEWRNEKATVEQRQAAKMQAVAIADRAGPYLHPRLASSTVNATINRRIADLSTEELLALAGEGDGEGGDNETPISQD